jgi:hypothetical protein
VAPEAVFDSHLLAVGVLDLAVPDVAAGMGDHPRAGRLNRTEPLGNPPQFQSPVLSVLESFRQI